MAWREIQAADDLAVEPWSSGTVDSMPLLRIRSKATGNVVVVYLDEGRHLVDALVNAAADLRRLRPGVRIDQL